MMTKDKKPFTYTPGMGGKLDLSQIRSPRMARRVAKNANDEGIEGPPKSSLATEPRPISAGPNLYIQPQVAVPVFPTNLPLNQPSTNRASSAPTSRVPSNGYFLNLFDFIFQGKMEQNLKIFKKISASDRVVQVQRPRVETKMSPQVTYSQLPAPESPTSPTSPTTPPQVTLAKAPTPWLQNKNKSPEELPEWAKRSSLVRPSSSSSPDSNPGSPSFQPQVQQTIELQQPPPPSRNQTIYQQPPPPSRQQSHGTQERVIPLRVSLLKFCHFIGTSDRQNIFIRSTKLILHEKHLILDL